LREAVSTLLRGGDIIVEASSEKTSLLSAKDTAPEVYPNMTNWRQRPLFTRLLVYSVAATLAFVMAAGIGAMTALVVSGDLSWPTREAARQEEPSPAGGQGNTPQHQQATTDQLQQQKADTEREHAASRQKEATYIHRVGEIQASSVETFLDSNEKLLRYDALSADDVEEMQANQASLQELTHEAGDLDAPQKYKEQKEVFLSAINELHEAAQLAYALAADPTSATQSAFEDYDRHVDNAATGLQRSNEILNRAYKTIEGVQRVSPSY
jgi:hypothetical protein